MTRSDGTFPHFKILLVRIGEPESGWNDGARRCMTCNRMWPNHIAFKTAPCCNMSTALCRRVLDLRNPGSMKDAIPQMGWDEAVRTLLHVRFEMLYKIWNEDTDDAHLYFIATEEVDEEAFLTELCDIDELVNLC